MSLTHMFPDGLLNLNWNPADGLSNLDLNQICNTTNNLAQLALLNAQIAGKSITFNWSAEGLLNWQKFWAGSSGTGLLVKQIEYTWSGIFCTAETYTFYDYNKNNIPLRIRECTVQYTWNDDFCTSMEISDITETLF